jgi:hypothetical protein
MYFLPFRLGDEEKILFFISDPEVARYTGDALLENKQYAILFFLGLLIQGVWLRQNGGVF